jgi:hypothetical protein
MKGVLQGPVIPHCKMDRGVLFFLHKNVESKRGMKG